MKKFISILLLGTMFCSLTSYAIYNPDAPVVQTGSGSIEPILMTTSVEVTSMEDTSMDKVAYENYIRDNISTLSPVSPVLGGTWYVTNITWGENGKVTVEYEDGHIAETLILDVSTLDITTVQDEPLMCTLQYAPVCGQVQVQCITTPCPPIEQTFGNACMAGKNPILYTGECSEYVKADTYKKYEEKTEFIEKILSKIPVSTLQRLSKKLQTLIDNTKLLRIVFEIQQERITKYFFLKNVIDNELMER